MGGVNFGEEAVGGVNCGEEAVGDIPLYIDQITAGLPITAHWEGIFKPTYSRPVCSPEIGALLPASATETRASKGSSRDYFSHTQPLPGWLRL